MSASAGAPRAQDGGREKGRRSARSEWPPLGSTRLVADAAGTDKTPRYSIIREIRESGCPRTSFGDRQSKRAGDVDSNTQDWRRNRQQKAAGGDGVGGHE